MRIGVKGPSYDNNQEIYITTVAVSNKLFCTMEHIAFLI